MEILDQKTTQTISKFTENDVVAITERKINEIINIDAAVNAAQERVDSIESDPNFTNSGALASVKSEIAEKKETINDTLLMLTTIGSYSTEYNAIVIKGFHKKLRETEGLSESVTSAFTSTLEQLMEIREKLALPEDSPVEQPVQEEIQVENQVEEPVKAEEKPATTEVNKEEYDALLAKLKSQGKRIAALEDKAKLFMYCGLGVAVITLLSLIFAIIALAN